jgi:Protein of unknown function (DUF1402)
MTTKKPNNLSDRQPSDDRLAGWPGRQIPYTGRAPYQSSPDPDAEKQRQEVLELIEKHADDINRAALKYDVPPETIAGAILWEAIENYRPSWLNSGGPGRIHNETAFTLWREGKVPRGYVPIFDTKKPEVAIEYIAAIMNESAENYERIAGVNIRRNVGVLNTLYHSGDSKGKAELLRDKRKADLVAGRPESLPVVPSREMGEYVENYRAYIRTVLLGVPVTKREPSSTNNDVVTTGFDNSRSSEQSANNGAVVSVRTGVNKQSPNVSESTSEQNSPEFLARQQNKSIQESIALNFFVKPGEPKYNDIFRGVLTEIKKENPAIDIQAIAKVASISLQQQLAI